MSPAEPQGGSAEQADVGATGLKRVAGNKWPWLRLALAALFLFAAAAKFYAIRGGVSPNPQLDLLLSQVELLLALWLISSWWPRWLWVACVVFLGGLSFASFVEAVEGRSTCGCLGVFAVNPWVMFATDVSCLIALLVSRPRLDAKASGFPAALPWMTFTALVAAGLPFYLGWLKLPNPLRHTSAWTLFTGEEVVVDPVIADLGGVSPGGWYQVEFVVHNLSESPVRILGASRGRIISPDALTMALQPHERRQIKLEVKVGVVAGKSFDQAQLLTDNPHQKVILCRYSATIGSS